MGIPLEVKYWPLTIQKLFIEVNVCLNQAQDKCCWQDNKFQHFGKLASQIRMSPRTQEQWLEFFYKTGELGLNSKHLTPRTIQKWKRNYYLGSLRPKFTRHQNFVISWVQSASVSARETFGALSLVDWLRYQKIATNEISTRVDKDSNGFQRGINFYTYLDKIIGAVKAKERALWNIN